MNAETIDAVKKEIVRFASRVANLEKEMEILKEKKYTYSCPKESGAVRRASLDLTRALAEMRKPS